MKVLVTGLFTQAGLFAVRRFGQLGFEVIAADNHFLAFGAYSKYVNRRVSLPRLRKNPEAYAKALINLLKNEKIDYYFPSFEELYLLSYYREEILSLTKTIIPPRNEIMQLHDKGDLKQTVLNSNGFYPETFIPNSYNEFIENIDNLEFPLYIKIRQSRNSTGLRLVEKKEDLKALYDDVIFRNNLQEDQLPMLQRKIIGKEIVFAALSQNGKVVGESTYVSIRSIPRKGGTTTCRETYIDKNCSEAGTKFLNYIKWNGFIGIDIIIEEKTLKPYIIDVNPRLSVGINVGFYGGVDMIPEWIKMCDGKEASVLQTIKSGVKSSTHFADVMWLIYTYYKGPESWDERKKLRKDWWKNRKEINYDIISKDDWKPRLALNTFLLLQMIKMIYTKLEPSNLYLYYNVYNDSYLKQPIKIEK